MLYSLDLHESLSFSNDQSPVSSSDRVAQSGALSELSEVYRQWGFDSGYAQATRDHLEMFVANAEAVLGAREGTWAERDAARRLLYGFIARLERRMGQFGLNHNIPIEPETDRPLIDPSPLFADGLGI